MVQSPWPIQHTHWALAIEGACAQQDFLQQSRCLSQHTHINTGQKFKALSPQTQWNSQMNPTEHSRVRTFSRSAKTVLSHAVSIRFKSDVITWMQVNSSDGGRSERGVQGSCCGVCLYCCCCLMQSKLLRGLGTRTRLPRLALQCLIIIHKLIVASCDCLKQASSTCLFFSRRARKPV